MTDHPASWLTDPTGRHDHRYWDGEHWTDHVADAGVSATDPYDGPADAVPAAEPSAPTSPSTSPSGWATSASGWASPAETADEPATEPSTAWGASSTPTDEPTEPDPALDVAAPTGWGAPTTSSSVGDDTAVEDDTVVGDDSATTTPAAAPWTTGEAPAADEPTPSETTEEPATSPTSPWGTPAASPWATPTPSPWATTTPTESADLDDQAHDEPTAQTDAPSDMWGDTTTVAGEAGTEAEEAPASWASTAIAPIGDGESGGPPRSRKPLLLGLALLVAVGVVVALVLAGNDDGGSSSAKVISADIASQLTKQVEISDKDAKCVGDYIVKEIGPSKLKGVDFGAHKAPPALEAQFNDAFNAAITKCNVDLSGSGGTVTTTVNPSDENDVGDPAAFEKLLTDQYEETLGLPHDKAQCLAHQMTEAVSSGKINSDEALGEFFQYLDTCGIALEDLQQNASP